MTAAPTLVVYVKEHCAPCAAWLDTLKADAQIADLKARGVGVEVRVLGTRSCLEARRVVGNPPFPVRHVSDGFINNRVSATPTTELYLSGEQKLSYIGNRLYASLAHELDGLGLTSDAGYKSARAGTPQTPAVATALNHFLSRLRPCSQTANAPGSCWTAAKQP